MDAGRHGSCSPRGLFSWLLAAAGTPSPVFRRRDSAPFARPYRPGASREFPALHPAPAGSPGMIPCRRCCGGGGLRTRCVVRLSSRPRRPSRIVAARSTRSKRPSCFVAQPRPKSKGF
ncbi:hypothetical protein NDU88_000924 [Pleurodeles waltl]|uniref:Secreted protein n=1 Tax=Pleurodeles waltl TaxID=8319 RepID=A0AAV7WKV2_PLEWA|nr:hypothetical protein NDU88_000924 [Pleurodeles waltl]